MVVEDADAAWDRYRFQSAENSIMKASLTGQIDTLAAAMNDVNNKLDRLMPVAEKMMGDETALNTAAAQLPPMGMDMGGGEDDLYAMSEEEAGPASEDVGSEPAKGGNMPEVEEDIEKADVEETEPAPDAEASDEEAPDLSDDEVADFGESIEGENDEAVGEDDLTEGEGDIAVPPVDSTGEAAEEIPMEMDMSGEADEQLDEVGDNPVMAAYNAFVDVLKDKAHEAIDAGEMDAVNEMADAQALMDSIWGERMRPAMDRIYKSLRKSAGVGGADAPAMDKDKVTPATTKAKVDHPIETPSETGKFEDKGGAPRALDNVTKSADTPLDEVEDEDAVRKSANAGEGEHEEEYTEYENGDQSAVPNTANPGDAGPEFVDRDEFENTMYKSSGPSIPEALEIPSFRDFAKSGGSTFMDSIEALKKSSEGLGTELCIKKGMGSLGGMAGLIAAQNSIQKSRIEDLRSQYNDMDTGAREGPNMRAYSDYDEDDESGYNELRSNSEGDRQFLSMVDDDMKQIKGNPRMSPEDKYNEVSNLSDYRNDIKTEEVDAPRFADYSQSPSNNTSFSNDIDEFGMEKSCDDSVEKSSEMPVEGLENIEASGNADVPTDEVNGAFAKTGKKIQTFADLMDENVRKSGWAPRPDNISSFGGDLRRPALGEIRKSAKPAPRMGYGVDPHDVVSDLWDEYKLYKSRISS